MFTSLIVPDDYQTIQEAINNAESGDIIFVSSGVYYEHIHVNKTLVLIGEDRETTIIDGERGFESIVKITADNVRITGFTLRNTAWKWGVCGVEVYNAINCEIRGNNVFHTCHQIRLLGTRGSSVVDNVVSAPNHPFPQSAYGIRVENSTDCLVTNNNVSNNIGGIHLENAVNCTVAGNIIFQNGQGIRLYSPCVNNSIVTNTVYNNTYDGMIEAMPSNQTLSGNIFLGNFWSRYEGEDQNHDGIGDTPYDVGQEQDHYPLMGKFFSFNITADTNVEICSNSSIENLYYTESNATIKFDITQSSSNQAIGFCRVRIPHTMIPTPFKITVNGVHPTHLNASLLDDGLGRWIYFTYPSSNIKATISTEVLPPTFPSASLITLVIIVSTFLIILVAVMFHKKGTKSKENVVS
jgi:parallel beta-helix repeat protein